MTTGVIQTFDPAAEFQSLATGEFIAYDAALGRRASLKTPGLNETIQNITNANVGDSGRLLIQGGPNNLLWESLWDFGDQAGWVLTGDNQRSDIVVWKIAPGGRIYASVKQGYGLFEGYEALIGMWSFNLPPAAFGLTDETVGLGDARPVQPGWTTLFNGVDQYANLGAASELIAANAGTIIMRFKIQTIQAGNVFLVTHSPPNRVYLFLSNGALATVFGDGGSDTEITAENIGEWIHVALTWDSGTYRLYRNGVRVQIGAYSNLNAIDSDLLIAAENAVESFTNAEIEEVQTFKRELSEIEVNISYGGGEVADITGDYYVEEGAGDVWYDSTDGANHGGLINGPSWVVDRTVIRSSANERGYSDGPSGSAVPSRGDRVTDALGNPLQFKKRVPRPAFANESNCLSFNGVGDRIDAPHLTGTETVVSSLGTSTPSISAGQIDFTAGTCYDLLLSDGTRYTLAEGSGTTVYNVAASTNHGSTSGPPAWVTQGEFHWNLSKGFREDGAVNIPALDDGSAAADGGVITNPRVVGHNFAETSLDFTSNQPDDPAINGKLIPTNYRAGDVLPVTMSKRVVSATREDKFEIKDI